MKNMPEKSLQQAVYGLLNNDVTLAALVNGIYDNPPQSVDYPYIAFGRINSRD